MLHESTIYKLVLEVAHKHEINIAIAGGYPRDIALGRTPKDLDLVSWSENGNFKNWHDFEEELKANDLVIESWDLNPPSAVDDTRVESVLKLKGNIDVILWGSQYGSLEEVVDNFDFNINQWVLFKHGPIFLGKNYKVLTQLCGFEYTVSEDRVLKMINIAKELNWSTEECKKKMQ
tara:strand:- start:1381 stop:1908 length:528 start_codon:yes stop_codon:yes gene_type:complete